MDLDLTKLGAMHPLLLRSTALEYAHRAALGLARHSHKPGVSFRIILANRARNGRLHWEEVSQEHAELFDFNRITEDSAEAISLALAHIAEGWVVRRRLQRGEFADWLLRDRDCNPVALEISGVDKVDQGRRRLQEKLRQVSACRAAAEKAVCVVELLPPRSRLVRYKTHGH